jgi:RNA polymerase sigma factor (sigma-70 family)
VSAHVDAIHAFIRRRVPADVVEDLVQQTFLALVRALAGGTEIEDPGAWLLTVARRRIIDWLRARGRKPPPVPLPPDWEGLTERVLPADQLVREELKELVQVALGLLPPAQRALLVGYYHGGVSVAELAERAGLTEKACEMRLRRARATFARRYAEAGTAWLEGSP